MRVYRFYVPNEELTEHVWLRDPAILSQWQKILRFRAGQEVVLFDGKQHDRLYRLKHLTSTEAELEHMTDFVRKLPPRDIYLFWSLLKKDKNDWVVQKCTELGVSHFVPVLAERSEKTGFRSERAQKIAIEAAEQCGRSDIPGFREPIGVEAAIRAHKDKLSLYVCDKSDKPASIPKATKSVGVLVGPEGGWSTDERDLFTLYKLAILDLHDFTLRAETAAVAAVTKLV